MSTAITMVPSPALHERPSYSERSSNSSVAHQPTTTSPTIHRHGAAPSVPVSNSLAQRSGSKSPRGLGNPGPSHSSPSGLSRLGAPKIIVKKEPGSPEPPNSRPRPRRLDLSKNTLGNGSNQPASARPLTARDGLGIQEVGIACLSPGFVTQNPVMKEQLQRSLSVREQQRNIIEARLHQQSAKGDGPSEHDRDSRPQFSAKTPGMSRRNKAPQGLSIVAPSHEQFAHERVIQSAPLGHSFTGRQHPAPLTRHIANQPSNLSNTSHIHHLPANQTANRLPPISDVFGQGLSGHPDNAPASMYHSAVNGLGAMNSPSLPPPPAPPSARPREYKSAEEAQQEMAGGRPELLPKLVHYGGHQPPTPPSPAPGASRQADSSRSAAKRRTRAEYEDGTSPPLGHGPPPARRGPFGSGVDSPETQRAKREEFMGLCARAWDLFHS